MNHAIAMNLRVRCAPLFSSYFSMPHELSQVAYSQRTCLSLYG